MSREPVSTLPSRQPAALFDFDGTLLRGDSMLFCLQFVLRRHPASAGAGLKLLAAAPLFAAGLVDRGGLKEIALGMLRHVPEPERGEFFAQFTRTSLVPRLRAAALTRLRWHREQGHRLFLVSASVDLYLAHAARALEIPELVCSRAVLDPSPRLLGANCRGEEKVRRVLSHPDAAAIDWEASWAYGDSAADVPLMARCGHPIAVTPNGALRRIAAERGWTVERW